MGKQKLVLAGIQREGLDLEDGGKSRKEGDLSKPGRCKVILKKCDLRNVKKK